MYSIGEVAKEMNLSVPALRYYDDEGLLINIKRDANGKRYFDDKDLQALNLINCLKQTGLKIKEIKYFMDLCRKGNDSLEERKDFFFNQEKVILKEIDKLKKCLSLIKFKEWYYECALSFNDEEMVKQMNPNDYPKDIKRLYDKAHEKENY